MRKTTNFFATIFLLTFVEQACGQDNGNKLRNDPTYSTHNYKHANKAATAQRWKRDAGTPVRTPEPGATNLANYKRQTPNQPPTGGVTVGHTPSASVADRNYKVYRPAQSTGSVVAGTRKNQADTTSSTGN